MDRKQRSNYKEIFNSQYEEYRQLHANVDSVTRRFRQLEKEIRGVRQGTEDYEVSSGRTSIPQYSSVRALCHLRHTFQNVKSRIINEYREIKRDRKYIDQRKRCDYLHGKLGHIKRLIVDYDRTTVSAS